MTKLEDEDWLYRRGSHAGGERAAAPTPPPDDRLPPPTPVGHHRAPDAPATPSRASERTTSNVPAPAAPRGTPPGAPARRRPRVLRTIGLLALAFLVYLVAVPIVTWSQLGRTDAAPAGQRPAVQPGTLIVLAGSDSREGLSPEEQAQLGTGNDAGRRSDTLLLLYVPTVGRAALISVPRDSYVTVPGHGKNKINAAYAIGGPKLLVQTVEQNTGLRVDGYAEIGFGGFAAMVDAVGGIEVCPKEAIKDRDSNLDIPAGCQTFDGPTALGYVRMRKADPLGDLGRVQRQREVIGILARKVASPATVLLPWRYWGVNSAGARALTIGTDDGLGELAGLATGMLRIATGDGLTLTVPISNADLDTPSGSAVAWDAAASKQLFAEIARGDTSKLDRFVP